MLKLTVFFRLILLIFSLFIASKITAWQTETSIYALFLLWIVFCAIGALQFIISIIAKFHFYEGLAIALVPPIVFNWISNKGHSTDFNENLDTITQYTLIAFAAWNIYGIVKEVREIIWNG